MASKSNMKSPMRDDSERPLQEISAFVNKYKDEDSTDRRGRLLAYVHLC